MIMQCTLAELMQSFNLNNHLQFSRVSDGVIDDLPLVALLCLLQIFLCWEVYSAVFETPALLLGKAHYSSFAILEQQVLG